MLSMAGPLPMIPAGASFDTELLDVFRQRQFFVINAPSTRTPQRRPLAPQVWSRMAVVLCRIAVCHEEALVAEDGGNHRVSTAMGAFL
jgi:hypothetical protein